MQGRDISSNNHDGSVFNFADTKAAGVEVLYVKATQGNNYLNPYLIGDVRDAANMGLRVGVYHFYDPANGTLEEQADFFLRNGIHAPVGEGHTDLSQFLTLLPVFDYEPDTPAVGNIERFIAALGQRCGVYVNRSGHDAVGYGNGAFGWLAWPGWTTEPLPSVTAIVQTGQALTQGLGDKPADVDNVLNLNAISAVPTPKEIEEMNPQYVQLANGDLVALVVTPQNHLLEIKREHGTAGNAINPTGQPENMSIQDITARYPQFEAAV